MSVCTTLDTPAPPRDDRREEQRGLGRLAFTRLLDWLDDGTASNGETYLEMRRRLVAYFERRNRFAADELADETFNRIGRTLKRDGAIATTPPARYCYVVARFVFLEDVRRERRQPRSHDQRADAWSGYQAPSFDEDEPVLLRERRLECLDRGLAELPPAQRALVLEYYREAGQQRIARRRNIAERLGITMNALGIRACRIRAALEARVTACVKEE